MNMLRVAARNAAILVAGLALGGAGAMLLASAPAVAAPAAPAAADLRSAIRFAQSAARDLLAATKATSLSIALVDSSGVRWSGTFGVGATDGSKPSPTTLYGMGSVSKLLTTIAVMQLVDAGTVSLDAPVTDYIRDFSMASPEYQQITVRMLLSHSAGLPGTDNSNALTAAAFPHYADQVLRTLATQRLKTTPGAMSVYCNDCFTLASILVERMSGQPFTQYVHENILQPLGMSGSRYATSQLAPGVLAPVITGGQLLPVEVLNIYASGGLLSTPREMARLAQMLLNDGELEGVRILSPAAVREMGTRQLPPPLTLRGPGFFDYGLGWDSVAEAGLAAAGIRGWTKGGTTPQYHATFMLAPDEDLAVIAVAAGSTVGTFKVSDLAEEVLLSALAERGDIPQVPEVLQGTGPTAARPAAKLLEDVAGIYLAAGSAVRVVARPDGALGTEKLVKGSWVSDPSTFTYRSDGQFWATDAPYSSLDLQRGWGRPYLILQSPSGSGRYRVNLISGQRVRSASDVASAWHQRLAETWLNVNEMPDSLMWQSEPTLFLTTIPGLPGILWIDGFAINPQPLDARTSDDRAVMFLQIPLRYGRDLNDLRVIKVSGEEWVTFGSSIFRPASRVPALALGANAVKVGPNGYAEWRTVPEAMSITVSGAAAWKAYGADTALLVEGDAGTSPVLVPAGGRIVVFGQPGTTIGVAAALRGKTTADHPHGSQQITPLQTKRGPIDGLFRPAVAGGHWGGYAWRREAGVAGSHLNP